MDKNNRPVVVMVPIELLRSHPKQNEYFQPLDEQTYTELKTDIEQNGIRTPLLIRPDYTVISGHQRLRAGQELYMKTLPCIFLEIDEDESERALIADNVLRRHLTPMELSNLAAVLKKQFGIKNGARKKEGQKGIQEIADLIGQSERHTHRLLKLQDLIPPIKELVAKQELTAAAAEQLAYLSPETQGELYQALGTHISNMKSDEIKKIRQQEAQLRRDNHESHQAFTQLQTELQQVKTELEEAKKIGGDIEELETKRKNLQEQCESLTYSMIDYDNARQALKNKEDPGTLFMRQVTKIMKPLWESGSIIESLSKDVTTDPYGTLTENLQRNADLLKKLAGIMEHTIGRISNHTGN